MNEQAGLRARKKERTRQAISEAAISLFLEVGYDQVSVADVAAAAEVSKPTLFRYFPSKEDLVLHRIADHQGEWARVVRERASGESPLDALHRHFLAGLHGRDPVTGLNDHPAVLAFLGLVYSTAALRARLVRFSAQDQEALAEALGEAVATQSPDLAPRLAAGQLVAVHQVLAHENWRKIAAGRTADEVLGEAVGDADRAFHLLGAGLGGQYG
ncbi:TetR/AcrR family transcriptional regulator [Kitasatospora kifunensis]|uniref:AcrR family transcriptional regulator n=1 Tax=Kitasatospora kifunensis TaxID=58351 RepID=A0A7W7QZD3_KITKI|nr:TetR/AcrR family transcriptional regulator [Kitasatospora kifunensis]MBB4922637.1 AcrR family transcriptional regulator [Kitasatospora kifunensis]